MCVYTCNREGNGIPLQYSCLEYPMDGGAWWAAVYGVAKSWTRLSDFTFIFHFHALEKEMATHSSVLAWRILETGEPGGLPSVGPHRVGHDWSDLAYTCKYFLVYYMRGTKISEIFIAMSMSSSTPWFLIPFSNKNKQDSSEKWLILELGQ